MKCNFYFLHSLIFAKIYIYLVENVDTLFNYVLLLIKLNDKAKACKVWLDAKSSNLKFKNLLDAESEQEELAETCFTVTIKDLKQLNTFIIYNTI